MITGATRGIGAAVAEAVRERGHEPVLAGRSAEDLKRRAERLGGARTVLVDLGEPHRIADKLADIDVPSLDGVVHSAGVVDLGPVAALSVEAWTSQMMVNVVAAAELTRVLMPRLRAARGHVVFINSGSGLRAGPGWSAYAASKHALRALADSLRAEEPQLRVTSVYPGRTATDMQRKVRAQEGGSYRPESYIEARTVAHVVVQALETPPDAVITDVSVRR